MFDLKGEGLNEQNYRIGDREDIVSSSDNFLDIFGDHAYQH